jgi:hypothetical protein
MNFFVGGCSIRNNSLTPQTGATLGGTRKLKEGGGRLGDYPQKRVLGGESEFGRGNQHPSTVLHHALSPTSPSSLPPSTVSMLDSPGFGDSPATVIAPPRESSARGGALARPKREPSQHDLSRISGPPVAFDVDPSTYPDPYPSSHPWMSPVPALSSGSSNSARSSAYTNLRDSGDSGHVQVAVASNDEIGLGITSDEPIHSRYETTTFSRAPVRNKQSSDALSRWSGASYSNLANGTNEDRPQMHRRYDSQWSLDEDSYVPSTDDEKLDEGDSFELPAPTQAALSADAGKGVILDLSKHPLHSIPPVNGEWCFEQRVCTVLKPPGIL